MDRRRFVRAGLLAALCGGLAGTFGCGGEAKKTGTLVETPSEDRASMEASAAAYRAMEKQQAGKRP